MSDDFPSDLTKRLRAVVRVGTNQSSLKRWLTLHHDAFAEIVAGVSRVGWASVAVELGHHGLTKADGSVLTGEYCRIVWWKVRRAHRVQPEVPAPTEVAAFAIPRAQALPAQALPADPPPPADDGFEFFTADGSALKK